MSKRNSIGKKTKPKKNKASSSSRDENEITIEFNLQNFLRGMALMSAEPKFTLDSYDGEGFRLFAKPFEEAFGMKLDSEFMKQKFGELVAVIREKCVTELKSKMLCLKLDVAVLLDRRVLGVNAQYVDKGVIRMETLGMIEVTVDNCYPEYLKKKILTVLSRYGIKLEQLYAIITDSGSNSIDLLQFLEDDDDDRLEIFVSIYESDDRADQRVLKVVSSLTFSSDADHLTCVRSIAHLLQLAIGESLEDLKEEFIKARQFVIEMQKPKHRGLFSPNGTQELPFLDDKNRWMSTYMMLENLYQHLQFYKDVSVNHKIDVKASTFDFIANFVVGFKPIFTTTKKFQEEQLTIGDFVCAWENCCMMMSEIVDNPYSEKLQQKLKEYRDMLFENDAIRSALYLDPRFTSKETSILTSEQTKLAQEHLFRVWKMLKAVKSIDENSEEDKLWSFIEKSHDLRKIQETYVKDKIDNWQKTILQRQPFSTDVLKFFEDKKEEEPEMCQLVEVIMSMPTTQISLKRVLEACYYLAPDTVVSQEDLENVIIKKFESQ